MKFFILALSLVALTATGFAQSTQQIDAAIAKLLSGTGRPNNSLGGPPNAGIASGVIGTNNKLAFSADSSGNLVIHNTANGFTHKFVFTTPTANRTVTFGDASGSVSMNPL
jgi:hypothetical protein